MGKDQSGRYAKQRNRENYSQNANVKREKESGEKGRHDSFNRGIFMIQSEWMRIFTPI